MSENKATLEAVMGFEAGYEKGVRDMWDKMPCFDPCEDINKCDGKSNFETCPIAQKLLKAV